MLKVLMVGPDRSVHGGISALVNSYYECGLDTKVELKYIGTMKEGSKLKKLMVAALAYLRFAFCVRKYDIVHVNFSSDNSFRRKSFFIKCAYRHGKKIVIHQHGGDFKTFYGKELDDSGRKYVREIFELADAVLVLTRSWKEFFGTITDADKITVLPNGVCVGTDDAESTKRIQGKRDIHKIIFLGRICRDKGIDELIEAVDAVHNANSEVKLYLGGIYEEPEYEDKVRGKSDFIKYLGWITGEEKEKYLEECGILVLPSYYEGFPVSILDGMLKGLVVIASAVGGIPDIIDDGVDGFLIEPHSSQQLKEKIEMVMADEDMAERVAVAGMKKVREKYSLEKITDKLVEIYKGL